MPFTLNGIGTRYYGAANRSAHVGVCQSCGRSATISSYDTREWFCVIYIPLIPIAKYRILNDCSSCRRHHRIRAKEFAQKVQTATEPLRAAIQRSPREPEPYLELIRTLIGWEMRSDAERELQAAVALFPSNVEMMLLGAQLAVDRGDWNGALPLYERAHRAEPQNPAAVYGYGWLLHQMQRHEQAVSILQSAALPQEEKAGVLYLIGASQMKLSRWNDALNSFQQLLMLEPKYREDKMLLRQMRECKQHLGYELNDAERRAGRSWWPFARKAKTRPVAPQGPPSAVRPSLRIAGLAILALMIISLVAVGWDKWTNIEVYFDNSLDRAVRVELDSRRFDLARNSRRKEVMHKGSHTAVVRQSDGKELERLPFRLDQLSIFDAVMHDRFFVYNVAAQRVYRRATHGYARSRENSSYSEQLIGMQRFFEQRDVDYPFQQAPESISIDANSSSAVKKISFNAADDVDLTTYALIGLRQGKTDEAKTAMQRAAANAPCDTRTRRAQVYFAGVVGSPDAASQTARQWMADCAENDLEAHRMYQDVNNERGRREALREEYRRQLTSSPDSAKAHYLYGRVAADPAAAAAEYDRALRLDPKLTWARVALGHAYQLMERYDDALRELSAAIDMEGRDPSTTISYAMVAIAKGTPDVALAKVEEVRKSRPRELPALEARWLLALAAHDWQAAAETQKAFAAVEGAAATWWRNTKLLRLKDDPSVDARIDAAMRNKDLHRLAVSARIERLIEKGDFAEAADFISRNAKELDANDVAIMEAYVAGGLILHGDAPAAAKLLTEAEKALAEEPNSRERRIAATVVEGLRGTMPLGAVMAEARESDAMAHGWFVAAARAAVAHDRARAKDCLAHAVRAASNLEFPYLEAKATAARMSGSGRS